MKKVFILAAFACCSLLMSSCCNCEKQSCPNNADKPATEACAYEGEKDGCPDKKRHRGHHHGRHEKGKFSEFPCDRFENMSDEERENCKKWCKFDSLSTEEQKELISKRKACIDKHEAEMKAKREEFEQKWANFDNLSIEEQKALLDQKCRMNCPNKPFGHKKFMRGKHHQDCKRETECPNKN